jgi:hypothetical protein
MLSRHINTRRYNYWRDEKVSALSCELRLLGLRGRARACMVIILHAFGMRGAVAHPGRRVPGDLFCFASGHASPTLGCEI